VTRSTTLQAERARRVDRCVRRLVASLALTAVTSLASQAPAEPDAPRGIALTRGAGAEACPDADALAAAVSRKAGRAALVPRPASGAHAIDARIDRGPRGFEATIQVDGTLRALEDAGPSCRPLADALTLMLVILLDEGASAGATRTDPADATPAAPGAETAPTTDRERVDAARVEAAPPSLVARPLVAPAARARDVAGPPPPRARAFGLSTSVRAALTDGVQEPGAIGVDARLRLDAGAWLRFEAGALALPTRAESFAGGTAHVTLGAAEGAACAHLLGRAALLHGDACLDLAAGALWGSGDGFSPDRTSTRAWGAVGASAAVEGPLAGPIGWSARGGFLVPFEREFFQVDGAGDAFRAAPIGGVVSLGFTATIF
jgi:hypothetical protein